ncbi:MAG: thiamine pyrophosphate-binding protein [Acidobacteriota bacterium]
MREVVHKYLGHELSRRGFLKSMTALGFTAAAAETVLEPLEASEHAASALHVPGAIGVEGTGGELLVAQAKAAGTRFLFTNPGSLEVGLFDAFVDTPGMQLIMGLHEGVVCSMADGYHRVSRKPALINVHVIAGTAQMSGQLFNASRDGSSLVVTAGLNDNERWNDDLPLAPRPGFNQKDINRQFTKISWEARHAESLALMLRRAYKVAATEPGGPVYLAMTNHALQAKGVKGTVLPAERFMLRGRVRADEKAVEETARMLLDARRPLLVAGDEVWKSGAQEELLALSEILGLAVSSVSEAFRNFPTHHPHYLGRFSAGSDFAKGVDLVVFVGSRDFSGRRLPESPEVSPHVPVVRIGIDTAAMGRTHATDLALVSDVKECLADLRAAVESLATKERIRALAESGSREARAVSSAMRAKAEAKALQNMGKSPIHPDELGAVLARAIDPDAILVHENFTGRNDAFRFGFRDGEQMFMGTTGGSLGWGVGTATGAKLGAPDRQVVCSIGDGAVMYSASGFWSQARYGIPVLTVVWNNHNYQMVRFAFDRYKGKMAKSAHYPGMYLGDPDIDFVQLARSQGLAAERVERGADLEAALKRGVAATRAGTPYLLDVEIARYGGGAESTWHQKFNLAAERKRNV